MITQGDPFLLLVLYFNNSTGKRNIANITLIDILLRFISSYTDILAAVLNVHTRFTVHSISCTHSIPARPSFIVGLSHSPLHRHWLKVKPTPLYPSFLSFSRFPLGKWDRQTYLAYRVSERACYTFTYSSSEELNQLQCTVSPMSLQLCQCWIHIYGVIVV